MKTSFIEKNIGKHEHDVTIYDSYQIYAVCNKCGLHDWGEYKGEDGPTLEFFKKKYPKHKIIDLVSTKEEL